MLREQRLSLFDGGGGVFSEAMMTDTLHDSKIERLYLECVALNEDMGMYTESAGETIKKAFEKLKEFIRNIINKVKSTYVSVQIGSIDNIPNNVEIDEENLSKTRKFLRAVKKLLGQSFEKLAAAIKNHKVIAGVSVAFVLSFTALSIVKKKTNDEIKETNAAISERNKAKIDALNKRVVKESIEASKESLQELAHCEEYATKIEKMMNETSDERKKKIYRRAIRDNGQRAIELTHSIELGTRVRAEKGADVIAKDIEDLKNPVTYAEIIHKFLLHITKTLNAIISKIASVVKKKDK